VLATLILAGCGKSGSESEMIRPVYAVKVGDLNIIQGRDFPGRANARHGVDLSFRVSGPLVSLPVDVGSRVESGEIIAMIDPRDFQNALDSAQGNLGVAQAKLLAMERGARPEEIEQLKAALSQAEANYRQAEADHQRNEKLLPAHAVSQAGFDATAARRDAMAAQVTKAREDLNIGLKGAREEDIAAQRSQIKALKSVADNAKDQLAYTRLKAPFAGTVVAKYVDNFQMVQAMQPIVRLLDISKIEVTVQVPESLISLAPRVKKVVCRFDAFPDREFVGQVIKIGSEASQTTCTYPVTVTVDQPGDVQILPGMAATVRAEPPEGEAEAGESIIVPPGAVFTLEHGQAGQQSYVWVIDEGSMTVAARPIRTGTLTHVGITVEAGLKIGECVVTAGVHSLHAGQLVRLAQEGSR